MTMSKPSASSSTGVTDHSTPEYRMSPDDVLNSGNGRCCIRGGRCLNGSSANFGTTKKDLQYVGESQGVRDQVHGYSYVGDGASSLSREVITVHPNTTCRKLCVGMLATSALASVCIGVAYMVVPSRKARTSSGSRDSGTYNCTNDNGNWDRNWSIRKRDWCCTNTGRGCNASTTFREKFNCQDRFANWQQTWSDSKKEWCCHKYNRACADRSSSSSLLFDCSAGFAHWITGWTASKKQWCCTHAKVACAKHNDSTTQEAEHRTQHTVSTPVEHAGGCNTECVYRSQKATCKHRIVWAANHQFIHVPKACAVALVDTLRKCPVCRDICTLAGAGCQLTTPAPVNKVAAPSPFDCQAGLQNWEHGWSLKKKDWCCENLKRGCPLPSKSSTTVLA